jgi:hypothetical protein
MLPIQVVSNAWIERLGISEKEAVQQVAEDTEFDRECVKTLTRYFLGQLYVLQI